MDREWFAEYIKAVIRRQEKMDFTEYTPKEAVLEVLKAMWADIVSGEPWDVLIKELEEE